MIRLRPDVLMATSTIRDGGWLQINDVYIIEGCRFILKTVPIILLIVNNLNNIYIYTVGGHNYFTKMAAIS